MRGDPRDHSATRPRLAPHVRLTFDARRSCWVLLAPERLLMPDEVAVEVLRRCTGQASIDGIVDDLARVFEADRDEIARDVECLVRDLCDKGVLLS
jgi:pyrroloquinoline quinone biosynthesis protein D